MMIVKNSGVFNMFYVKQIDDECAIASLDSFTENKLNLKWYCRVNCSYAILGTDFRSY